MMELRSPIRLYWDLTPRPAEGWPDLDAICTEVAAGRFLVVELRDDGPVIGEATARLVGRLAASGPAVTLTVAYAALPTIPVDVLAGRLKSLLVLATAPLEVAVLPPWVERLGCPVGVALAATRQTIIDLPAMLQATLAAGLTQLALPMQRLTGGEEPFIPAPADLATLQSRLAKVEVPAGFTMTIHDPFLWQAINPAMPFPGGGCQGANTMLHLAPDGGVYPCPSLPFRLGSLPADHLRDLLDGQDRAQLREALRQAPVACLACRELSACRGGCRGRGLITDGTLLAIDPACGSVMQKGGRQELS